MPGPTRRVRWSSRGATLTTPVRWFHGACLRNQRCQGTNGVGRISEGVQTKPDAEAQAARDGSTIYRARRVLAIRPFRRLWGVTYLCSVADWLTILGVTSLATKLTQNYTAQNFAFTGVLLSALLPGLIFAPLGGLLADRFDRRKIMFIADLLRCSFVMSIAFVGTGWWL